MRKIFTILFAATITLSLAQVKTRSYLADAELAYRAHTVNFTNMRLDVSFEPEKGLVKGNVTLDFTPYKAATDSIWLDGINMTIKKLTLNGKDADYKVYAEGI